MAAKNGEDEDSRRHGETAVEKGDRASVLFPGKTSEGGLLRKINGATPEEA